MSVHYWQRCVAILLLLCVATLRFTLPTSSPTGLDALNGALRRQRSSTERPERTLAAAHSAARVAAPPQISNTEVVSRRIPHRLLFLYGFWADTFQLPLNDSAACDFASLTPPPCVRLSGVAHLLPANVAEKLSAWTARYASWESVVLDFAGATKLAAARLPEFSATLEAAQTGVQRSDIARLLMLAAWGGVYADADAAPAASDLGELLDTHAVVNSLFFEETVLTPEMAAGAAQAHHIRGGVPEARQRIANYFMASTRSETDTCDGGAVLAILRLIDGRVRRHMTLSADKEYEILFTTGPDAVTDAVHMLRGWRLDGTDITDTTRLDAAKEIQTVVRDGDRGQGAACASVIPRPVDQLYFAHGADGAWKGRPL